MKLNGLDIVIFPLHNWRKCIEEGFRTRDAHLILEFEKNPLVRKMLIVGRPITIPEMLLKKSWWRVKNGRVTYKRKNLCLTQVSEKIFVLDIFSFDVMKPLFRKHEWWGEIFSRSNIIRKIKECINYLKINNFALFLWSPFVTGTIGKMSEKIVVFDAIDNWLVHPEVKTGEKSIKEGYQIVKEKSDLIFTNSQALKEFLGNNRENTFCIPNGVSPEFFSIDGRTNGVPEDLQKIPHPRIGYAGKLAKRIDVDLISFLATRMPDVNFVFIGPILNRKWIKPLFKFKNIHFMGDKHYSKLPAYLSAFDICLIPHNVGPLENQGDPIKLYEYISSGKPVVTTDIAGVDRFKDVITIAGTKEEFIGGIRKYLEIQENAREQMSMVLRDSIPSHCFWENKAKQMIDYICDRLNNK